MKWALCSLAAVALLALAIPRALPAQEGSTQNSAIVPEELLSVMDFRTSRLGYAAGHTLTSRS